MTKEELRAKVCHVCGTTEDLVACPACHWWFCKEHDLHECTPEPQTPTYVYVRSKPSSVWYLVPLLFGFLGGLVAYFGLKNDDKDMATNMLVFGLLWSIILGIIYWVFITSRIH